MTTLHVMFSTDGKGHWWRREWKPQCPEKVFIMDRCQGVIGHEGDHWCFSEKDGSACLEQDEDHPDYRMLRAVRRRQTTKSIVHRWRCRRHCYMSHYTDSDVTDPEEIARLDRGETSEGESINRACTPQNSNNFNLKSTTLTDYTKSAAIFRGSEMPIDWTQLTIGHVGTACDHRDAGARPKQPPNIPSCCSTATVMGGRKKYALHRLGQKPMKGD